MNRTFAAWLDTTADELVGRRFQDLLTVGGRIFHHTHWAPLMRLQGSISEVKLELTRNGETIPMVFNCARRGDGQEIAAFVARDRDRYERELLQSRRRLEAAVTEVEALHDAARDKAAFAQQMMGIVSHDLRNPINAIQIAAEILAAQHPPPEQRRVLDKMLRATGRATELIEDLLDFTSASVGTGLRVELAATPLHAVVADGLDELRLLHPARTFDHQRRGRDTCRADGKRVVQLVGNLVSNAVVYGDPAAAITVTTAVEDRCRILVHNHGPIIPADLQATMFEPMMRGAETGARRSVGLGLFIVREIARAHGGSASVSSSEMGSTFLVEWPA